MDAAAPVERRTISSGLPAWLTPAALAAAVLAGVAAGALGEAVDGRYRPSAEAAAEPYAFRRLNAEKDVADGRNSALAYGILGGATGLALGVVAGLSRRSARGALVGGLTGLALGCVAPALVSPWVVPFHRALYAPESPDLKLPVLIHGAIWCALGVGAGLGFGVGLGGWRRAASAALGGLVGAALATLLYDVVGAAAFAGSRADLPIPDTAAARLLGRVLVASGVGLGAALAVREAGPRRQAVDKPAAPGGA
jgi:hypothetical protein